MRFPFALAGFVAVTLIISAPDLVAHGGGGSGGGGGWSGGGGHGGRGNGNFHGGWHSGGFHGQGRHFFFVVAFLVRVLAFMATDTRGGSGITPTIPPRITETMPITAVHTTATTTLSLTLHEGSPSGTRMARLL